MGGKKLTILLLFIFSFLYSNDYNFMDNNKEPQEQERNLGLAKLYENGGYVTRDFKKAQTYYIKACELKSSDSCMQLADRYFFGLNEIKQDVDKAKEYYEKACLYESSSGCYYTAQFYEKSDKQKALSFYVKACGLGDIKGCISQKSISLNSTKNEVVLKSYENECKDEDYKACYYLGYIYHIGLVDTVADTTKAINYYEKACEADIFEACAKIGDIYLHINSNKEQQKSIPFLLKACEFQNADGCYFLSKAYRLNLISNSVQNEDIKLNTKACELGSSDACFNLGISYQRGVGVDMNAAISAMFYKKSCALSGVGCDYYLMQYGSLKGSTLRLFEKKVFINQGNN